MGINWRRKWQPTPVFLPEESHGQLSGYSPWGHTGLDTTEATYQASKQWVSIGISAWITKESLSLPSYCCSIKIF